MIFFDAVIPNPGETFFEFIDVPLPSAFPNLASFYKTIGIKVLGENLWWFPPLPPQALGLTDVNMVAWQDERQRCQPIHIHL